MASRDTDEVPNGLIPLAEAARLREVTEQSIYNLIRHSRLPSVKIGGRHYLRREDVLGFKSRRGRYYPRKPKEEPAEKPRARLIKVRRGE